MSSAHIHRHIAAGAGARHAYELNHQRIAGLWAQAQPVVAGDAADCYLRSNGAAPLLQSTWPASLRLHPALDYWQVARNGIAVCQGKFLALLVLLQIDVFPHGIHRPAAQHAVALQRIYLTADGVLAPVASPIKLTGAAGPSQGAAAQLASLTPDANGWGVAVGVCAALRIGRATRMPVWAVPDAAALAHVRWPRGARSAHLFIDPREPAQWQPAAELARKASACGLDVHPMAVQLKHADGTPQFPQITATRL
jgi:putative DNA primase/helicase